MEAGLVQMIYDFRKNKFTIRWKIYKTSETEAEQSQRLNMSKCGCYGVLLKKWN